MKDKTYTILELSEKLDQSKQAIRRRIDKIGLKSINRHTREFPNEPLEYNIDTYTELADSFGIPIETKKQDDDTKQDAKGNTSDMQNNTNKGEINLNKDKIIEILERELKHSKEKLNRAENEKENLFQLLDQQQQLGLNDKNKIQALELELDDSENKKEMNENIIQKEKPKKKKGFFSRLFNL